MNVRALVWTSAVLVLGITGPAFAEESAETLVSRGLQLRRDHRDAEALDAFRRAYQLEASPRTRTQIALAEQALAQWVEAERDLLAALDSTDNAWIRGHAGLLQGALTSIRNHLGTIAVESNAQGVELLLNGEAVGTLPIAPLRVAAGEVEVELRRAQHDPVRRRFTLSANGFVQTVIEFEQKKESHDEAVAAADVAVDSAKAHAPQLAADQRLPAPPRPVAVGENAPEIRSGSGHAVAWAFLGGAGALLATAIVAQVVREQNAGRYNDNALCLQPGLSRDQRCGIYRGRADVATTVAVAGLVGAGLFGGASALMFLMPSRKPQATTVRAFIQAGPSGVVGDCVVSF